MTLDPFRTNAREEDRPPSFDERAQVWSARHPVFVFVVYPLAGLGALVVLAWWALK